MSNQTADQLLSGSGSPSEDERRRLSAFAFNPNDLSPTKVEVELGKATSANPLHTSPTQGNSSPKPNRLNRSSSKGKAKGGGNKAGYTVSAHVVAEDRSLPLDHGIDPSLDEDDKKSIIKYRTVLRKHIENNAPRDTEQQATLGDEVQQMVAYFEERTKEPRFLIHPDSQYMQRWDMVTLLALIFTAFVTPYEVALLDSECDYFNVMTWDPLFAANRVIDLVFLKDMCMQFFLAYRISGNGGGAGLLVRNFRAIRSNYLGSWFPIDLLSIIPFDLIAILANSDSLEGLKIIRIIRLLRLLKLARIFKASRIFKRLESTLSVSFSVIGLIKFATILLVMGHWMACAWCMVGGGVASQAEEGSNWIKYVACNLKGCDDDGFPNETLTPWAVYVSSFYWSIVTITSVGYGDVTPQNTEEMQWCTGFLLIGSCLWAYIIGSACGIISNLDVDTIEHQQTMDSLNAFMREQDFDKNLRVSVRSFFNQTKDLAKSENHKALISRMSPSLKEIVTAKNCKWIEDIWYLQGLGPSVSVALLEYLVAGVFTPQEKIAVNDCLCIVSRGVASRAGIVKTAGTFWGEDFILDSWDLKEHAEARALTYVEILVLSRESFYDCMSGFAEELKQVRKACVHLAVKRGIMTYTKAMKKQGLQGVGDIVKANIHGAVKQDTEENIRRVSQLGLGKGLTMQQQTHLHGAGDEHELHVLKAEIKNCYGMVEEMQKEMADNFIQLFAMLGKGGGGGGG
ncbi:hypothetical protein TrLO_g2224, partial [Triparma laevis f. longispina]